MFSLVGSTICGAGVLHASYQSFKAQKQLEIEGNPTSHNENVTGCVNEELSIDVMTDHKRPRSNSQSKSEQNERCEADGETDDAVSRSRRENILTVWLLFALY